MNTVPQVTISSTFFDLKQVRADIAGFLSEQAGYVPLMSEWSSFPIEPDLNTIENCRRRVERDADILILIIGGRHGSQDSSSSKSVTNIEYLAARAKRIPIYIFVDRRVLAAYPIWKENPSGNFSSVVDDTRIFSLVEEVRTVHMVWTQEFDLASDIVNSLKAQFAYLALQGAHFVQHIADSGEFSLLRQLTGAPLRIALEKPPGWEYKLFAQVVIQEVEGRRMLKEQMKLGIAYGPCEHLSMEGFGAWSRVRLEELNRIVTALTALVNEELQRALAPPGEPGDVELLVFVARSVAELYQEALEWGLRMRRVVPDDELVSVVRAMENFVADIVEKLESLGPLVLLKIDRLLQVYERGGPVPAGAVELSLQLPGNDQFNQAVDELLRRLAAR